MLTSQSHPWELRFDWTFSVLLWFALALGLVITAVQQGPTPQVALAAAITSVFAAVMQVFPRRFRRRDSVGELLAISGVVMALVAVALTDGSASPYLLFLATPTFFAAAFLGLRIGLETAGLTSLGLIAVVLARSQDVLDITVLQAIVFYLLLAVALSQARRFLVEEQQRSIAFEQESQASAARMQRLDTAHNLLAGLADLATTSELNPVSVGQAALRDLAVTVPFAGGEVAIVNLEDDLVVVARRGDPVSGSSVEDFPISIGGRALGSIRLLPHPERPLDVSRSMIEEALRPVALAFDNIRLLSEIAHRAVREERTRLARELHDEIGPALVAVGLGIDTAIHQHDPDPDMARYLETIRSRITRLVEEVRRTVADMRSELPDSIVEQVHRLAADVDADGPAIFIDIDEHRPPRSAIAGDISAILHEAFRNAVDHGGATAIHFTGAVNRNSGSIAIADNGSGFDVASEPKGHYGLIGMKERAAEIDAELSVESTPGKGTRVTIEWG
jgi:signal transduction histidine kinase